MQGSRELPGTSSPVARSLPADLLSAICHDLKEPLAAIVMGAGFLQRSLSTETATALRMVEVIQRAADNMQRRIAFFSEFARLEAGELGLEMSAYEVGPLLESVYELMTAQAKERNVLLSIEPDMSLGALHGDRGRLIQILQLLAACALRVTPEKGAVRLRIVPGPDGSTFFEIQARRCGDGESRPIVAELPKPELAMATGLIALHNGSLAVQRGETEVRMSFCLPPFGPVSATAHDRSRMTDEVPQICNGPCDEEERA
jgi:hypothetical protein